MKATDKVIGIALGVVLGVAIVVAFVFLGSRDTIDDPSISGGGGRPAVTQPAPGAGDPSTPLETQP